MYVVDEVKSKSENDKTEVDVECGYYGRVEAASLVDVDETRSNFWGYKAMFSLP